jgi:hypothetical protein
MPPSLSKIVAGNAAAYRDFLAFNDFRIAPTLLWREKPERFAETAQL